uniref:Elongator complex protein 5 n=1 Tax=Candidozyma auris TaxID=498019 RepID=A0A0L0NMT2_CANAR
MAQVSYIVGRSRRRGGMSVQNSVVLLSRHLSLKEVSPFNLVVDSLNQSAYYIIQEFVSNANAPVLLLSFENSLPPSWATEFMDCLGAQLKEVIKFIIDRSSKIQKKLVIIDSLNYIPCDELTSFMSSLVLPFNTVLAVYHSNCPSPQLTNYPSPLSLLNYIALAAFYVEPENVEDEEDNETSINKLILPIQGTLNGQKFTLKMIKKKKSGKAWQHEFLFDLKMHSYVPLRKAKGSTEDDDELLKDLTTFNLGTSSKQRLAKEQVELPFMEAQAELGKVGGAIVYQFEKDDDYDEEDPYEDPF